MCNHPRIGDPAAWDLGVQSIAILQFYRLILHFDCLTLIVTRAKLLSRCADRFVETVRGLITSLCTGTGQSNDSPVQWGLGIAVLEGAEQAREKGNRQHSSGIVCANCIHTSLNVYERSKHVSAI